MLIPERKIQEILSREQLYVTDRPYHRLCEIVARLLYLIEQGELDPENLKGKIFDLGTGSGVGVIAFWLLRATNVVGVDNGQGLIISQSPRFSDCDLSDLIPNRKLLEEGAIIIEDNQEFLKGELGKGMRASLVTGFAISYVPPIKEIEAILVEGGQAIFTAEGNKQGQMLIDTLLNRSRLGQGEIIETDWYPDHSLIKEHLPKPKFANSGVADALVFIGTKTS
jgi:hypothetical protein